MNRFAAEAASGEHPRRSIICLPIISNRGQIFGGLYLSSKHTFAKNRLGVLHLLTQQASIAISNALLFRSVQQATKANIQMISNQKQALEDARRSREEALQATKARHTFSLQGILGLHWISDQEQLSGL